MPVNLITCLFYLFYANIAIIKSNSNFPAYAALRFNICTKKDTGFGHGKKGGGSYSLLPRRRAGDEDVFLCFPVCFSG